MVKYVSEAVRTIAQAMLLLVLMIASFWFGWRLQASRPIERGPVELPTIREVQKMVGAEPDGRLGPETQKKWERLLCDKQAAEAWPP